MGMTFEEMQKTDIAPTNFGVGWHLATSVGPEVRVVLCAQTRAHQGDPYLASSDERGVATDDAALPVLQHIARCWNERAAKLRAGPSPVPADACERPTHRHVPGPQGHAGRHLYEIRSPFEVGDRVLTESEGSDVGTIRTLAFHVIAGDRVERRAIVDFTRWQLSRKVEDLRHAPSGRAMQIGVGDRVTPNFGVEQGKTFGQVTGLYLRDGYVFAEVRWEGGETQDRVDPNHLRHAL